MGIEDDSQYDVSITGSLTALNSALELDPIQKDSQLIAITGTWVGTVSFQISVDGTNWVAATVVNVGSGAVISSTTANGTFVMMTAGCKVARVIMTAYGSGTALVANEGSTFSQYIGIISSNPASLLATVTQGTSPWVVSGTVTAAEDKNYGVVGANTARSAAQIGNATGAADFNAGATGAQTLRTVANQGAPNTAANGWFQRLTDGTDNVAVTANNDLSVSDGLSNGGVNGALTLTTANTAYQAKVGASALVNLKNLTITALDDMFWGYNNTVTTATGSPLYKNQVITFDVDPDSTFQVWLVASANGKTARIAEST